VCVCWLVRWLPPKFIIIEKFFVRSDSQQTAAPARIFRYVPRAFSRAPRMRECHREKRGGMGRWAVGKPNCGIANSRTKMRTTADCSQLTTEIENSAEQSAKRRCCCRGVVVAFAFAASLLPLTRRHRCRTQTALPHRPLAMPLPHRLFATATGCSHPPSGPKAMSHEPASQPASRPCFRPRPSRSRSRSSPIPIAIPTPNPSPRPGPQAPQKPSEPEPASQPANKTCQLAAAAETTPAKQPPEAAAGRQNNMYKKSTKGRPTRKNENCDTLA